MSEWQELINKKKPDKPKIVIRLNNGKPKMVFTNFIEDIEIDLEIVETAGFTTLELVDSEMELKETMREIDYKYDHPFLNN